MKKQFVITVLVIFVLVSASSVFAQQKSETNFSNKLQSEIDSFLSSHLSASVNVNLYAKVPLSDSKKSEEATPSPLSYNFDENTNRSGFWGTDDNVNLIGLKAGNELAFQWLGWPGEKAGEWDTQDLERNGNGMTHLYAWTAEMDTSNLILADSGNSSNIHQNPEPTTILLFGLGLLGLAGVSRKNCNHNKKYFR